MHFAKGPLRTRRAEHGGSPPGRVTRAALSLRLTEGMTLLELFVYLVIGGASGAIMRVITRGSTGWFLVSALLGFLGALLGTSVAHVARLQGFLALHIAGHLLPVLWAMSGAIFLAIWGIAAQVLISSHAQSERSRAWAP